MVSNTFQEDIEQVIADKNIPWREMSGTSVFITGVTGLIGSVLARVLDAANKKYGLKLKLAGHGRNIVKGGALGKECEIEFIGGDIRRPIPVETLPSAMDYIFHCAAITQSADMAARPVDVITTAIDGTRNVLEMAKERCCGSLVYVSSMEVYGRTDLVEVRESDLGYVDLAAPRSSYPESKRLCENLCAAYAGQYGIPVRIARLAQTFGAGTPRDDTRVFAQFARSAVAGNDIELHTEGKSRGNYSYTADTVRGLLTLLLKAREGGAYNIANPDASMTVREMAELVANEICGGKIKVVVKVPENIQKYGYAPDVGFTLNVDKLKELKWNPAYGLGDMYKRMIADWQKK